MDPGWISIGLWLESDAIATTITVRSAAQLWSQVWPNRSHDCGCNSVGFLPKSNHDPIKPWSESDHDLAEPRLGSGWTAVGFRTDRGLNLIVSRRCRAVGRARWRRCQDGVHELLTKRCVYIHMISCVPTLCATVCTTACVRALTMTIIQWEDEPVGVSTDEPPATLRSGCGRISVGLQSKFPTD